MWKPAGDVSKRSRSRVQFNTTIDVINRRAGMGGFGEAVASALIIWIGVFAGIFTGLGVFAGWLIWG